jgi:hypothetical protein
VGVIFQDLLKIENSSRFIPFMLFKMIARHARELNKALPTENQKTSF